jgi:hypothetical protein
MSGIIVGGPFQAGQGLSHVLVLTVRWGWEGVVERFFERWQHLVRIWSALNQADSQAVETLRPT